MLNEIIELSGIPIDPGSRHQLGFTIAGNKEGIDMAKQLISGKLVSSRYVVVLRLSLLHICVLLKAAAPAKLEVLPVRFFLSSFEG